MEVEVCVDRLMPGKPMTPCLLADKELETAPPAEFTAAPAVLPAVSTTDPAVDLAPPNIPPPDARAPEEPMAPVLLVAGNSSAIAAALA